MKAKAAASIAGIIVALCGVWLVRSVRTRDLPRVRLSDCGEFRVLKVCYGTEDDHHFGGAPKPLFWLWNRLPKQLQSVVPYPDAGVSGISPFPDHPAISIWWAWFDPVSGNPILGPSGDVVMTLDSGEQKQYPWPEPGDDFRQIFIHDPPKDSKRLRFSVPVNELDQPAVFEIENPAYGK